MMRKLLKISLLVYIFVFFVINTVQLAGTAAMAASMANNVPLDQAVAAQVGSSTQQNSAPVAVNDAQVNTLIQQLIPAGIPAVYGAELSVDFGKAAESMAVLESYDRGDKEIPMEGSDLARYVAIAMKIACEFCCGAQTLAFENGRPACGCAHSAAMRGVAKYLIANHGKEYTDDQILAELAKWKAAFFPQATVQKALAQQGGSSSVNLPSQVGGC